MKKIIGILLCAALLVTMFASCGGGSKATSLQGAKVGVCIYKFDDNFMTLYRTELEKYLKEKGAASVSVMDGKNDQAEQTNQINNFITQGVDLLIINLVQSSSASQIADIVHAKGVPTVFINREPDKAEQDRWVANNMKCTYVGADASQSGTFQGEIVTELPDKGDVNGDGVINYIMVMGDPENVDAQLRTEYSVKALTDAGLAVNLLDQQRGDWDQARGQEIVANDLTAYGNDVEVVFCNNDAMAMGALQAIESAGRTVGTDIYLLGVDALAEACTAILDGRMTGTALNDHFGQSHKAADVGDMFLKGEKVDPYYRVDYMKVTKDTAQQVLDLLGVK
ncbi:MAG: galactose ABC transporter substrate-binding protein [Oscillospiraceae bacterium]|jgi:methyl-galactoside transport system substrate-binding protein|nr:galactose ABC transporter substrate-binding protein [Oscillospiraceae bacterium]